jgi:hypothetical protein
MVFNSNQLSSTPSVLYGVRYMLHRGLVPWGRFAGITKLRQLTTPDRMRTVISNGWRAGERDEGESRLWATKALHR